MPCRVRTIRVITGAKYPVQASLLKHSTSGPLILYVFHMILIDFMNICYGIDIRSIKVMWKAYGTVSVEVMAIFL